MCSDEKPVHGHIVANILSRSAQVMSDLVAMRKNFDHDYSITVCMCLRIVSDLSLQLFYLSEKSDCVDKRIEKYIAYVAVEQKKRIQDVESVNQDFYQKIKQSDGFESANEQLEGIENNKVAEYFPRWETRPHGYNTWHGESMSKLSNRAGFNDEYRLIISQLNSWVHMSPITFQDTPVFKPEYSLFLCIDWLARQLDFGRCVLGGEFSEVIKSKINPYLTDKFKEDE